MPVHASATRSTADALRRMGLTWPSLRVSRARAAAAAVVGASIASAWGLAGHSRVGAALLAISLLVAAVGIVTQLGFVALLLWAPISVVTYPLFGNLSAHSYVTVDRVVIGAVAILLLIVPRLTEAAAASRMLTVALVLFTVGFGLRALAAPASLSATAPEWLDALVLPVIVFCV